MKRILNIFSTISLVVSTSSLTISCFEKTTTNIASLNFNGNLTDTPIIEVNEKNLITTFVRKNLKNGHYSDKELELFSNITIDKNSIKKESDTVDILNNSIYSVNIKAVARSRILTGTQKIFFKSNNKGVLDEKTNKLIEKRENNLSFYWYDWVTKENKDADSESNKWVEAPLLETVDDCENYKNVKYIKLAYSVPGVYDKEKEQVISNNYDTDFQYTLRNKSTENGEKDNNYIFLSTKKNKKKKYILSIGGASADKILFKWHQKKDIKKSLKELIREMNLDGIDISIVGETLRSFESKSTLSQAIREIKLENWLENKDFFVSASINFDHLRKDKFVAGSFSYIDLIESLKGYIDIISPTTFNVMSRYKLEYFEDVEFGINDKSKVKVRNGTIIEASIEMQTMEFYYAYLRSLLDENWSIKNNLYYINDLPIDISITSALSGFGYFNENVFKSAFEALKRDLTNESKKNIIGLNVFSLNDDIINSRKIVQSYKNIFKEQDKDI